METTVKYALFIIVLSVVVSAGVSDAAEAKKLWPAAGKIEGVIRKGEPLPKTARRIPYEDVLDHCDVVLAGKVVNQVHFKFGGSIEQPEIPGRVDLEVQKVLYGKFVDSVAKIVHGTTGLGKLKNPKRVYVFMCVRGADGTLRLAGDPPLGGGFVGEGVPLVEKLLEAKRDPVKGYQSKDFAVKLSSAYRLTRAWLKIPPKDRPAPPPELVETLVGGLRAYQHRLGQSVEAAPWNAISALFDCDIKSIWEYPPAMKKGRRTKFGNDVAGAWKRTVVSVRERRVIRANATDATVRAKVAALIEKLGSDAYRERQAARVALVRIGQPALKQVKEGAKSKNKQIAGGCRLLTMLIAQVRDYRPTQQSYRFNLDLAEPFVPLKAPKPAE
jgi:hypothetical protein